MKKLSFTVSVKSPLVVSNTVGGNNHISTADYIPGSSILGLMAGRYLESNTLEKPEHDKVFKRLFLSDLVKYRNATLVINDQRAVPVPFNIVVSKEKDQKYIDVFINDYQRNTKKVYGYIGGSLIQTPKKKINFHTSRKNNRLSGKSEDGEIFTYEGLDVGQKFKGEITGEEADLLTLTSLFGKNNNLVHIGRSKTAQYGEAILEFSDVSTLPEEEKSNIISLVSPAIILDKNGNSSTLLETMENHLNVKIKKAIIGTIIVESFNRKWGVKKPSETAFAAGSVFEVEGDIGDILNEGVGIRRNEGFGEVIAVNVNLSDLTEDSNGDSINRPNGHPPVEVLDIFRAVFEKECMIKAEQAAVVDKIRPGMPNTLTSRLLGVFHATNPMEEIQLFLTSIQTKKEEGGSVDKKAGEHLKRVQLKGKTLFNILSDAKSEPIHFYKERVEGKTHFLKSFPKEANINPEDFKDIVWIHYWKSLLTTHMKEK